MLYKLIDNNIKRILLILILGWMIAVFLLSNQNGKESTNLSREVTEIVAQREVQHTRKLDISVRKTAHVILYAVGGLLISLYVYQFKVKHKWILALTIGVIYAMTDEYHQTFIPGRDGAWIDVLIDAFGLMLGIIATFIVRKKE